MKKYDWINFYEAFAGKLLDYKKDRQELIKKLTNALKPVYNSNKFNVPVIDSNNELFYDSLDIDPFTVLSFFNRMDNNNFKKTMINAIKKEFNLDVEVPDTFDGIPVFKQAANCIAFLNKRKADDIDIMWEFFECALNYDDNDEEFIEKFDKTLNVMCFANSKRSSHLFCIKPDCFAPLNLLKLPIVSKLVDKNLCEKEKKGKTIEGKEYLDFCKKINNAIKNKDIPYNSIIELSDARPDYNIKETSLNFKGDINEENDLQSKNDYDLNTILYGPPGTGKTYKTVLHAVAICDDKSIEELEKEEYRDILERYKKLKESGRIQFTTFHQSYGYEEFVEGIKPKIDENNQPYYEVEDGCFKKFCKNASKKIVDKNSLISSNVTVWKTTIQKSVIKDCFENNRVRIGWALEDEGANGFVNDMKIGDIILTTDGSRTKINGIARVTSAAYNLESENDATTRDVEWVYQNISLDISKFNNGKMLHRMTVARVPNIDAIEILSTKENLLEFNVEKNEKPCVFIIDEINRGNISKIFGELITLIEDSKRSGRSEAMEVLLPYSGDKFSVPDNVYILGTMNTADRSIALLDTALRRRFSFKEMLPDPTVIENIEIEGIKISELLIEINNRIEVLYDREHTIGHAYFTRLTNNSTIFDLHKIFEDKIIPLLQEYFYDDYEKIGLILGDGFAKDEANKFIKRIFNDMQNLFGTDIDLEQEFKFEINKRINDLKSAYHRMCNGVELQVESTKENEDTY